MTIDEFKALKPEDIIHNPMTNSSGIVTSVDKLRNGTAVHIRWATSSKSVIFSEHSTAWMHWSLLAL